MEIIKEDFIKKIYEIQEEKLDNIIKEKTKEIQGKLNKIKLENISDENKKDIIDKLEENYGIKMECFLREYYKQGFKDGVNFIINCIEK